MPYATIDDLNARLKDAQIIITNTSIPNITQAQSILEGVEAEIHAYLRNRAPIPLSDPESIKLVRSLTISLTCERIYTLAYPQAQSNPFATEAKAARELLKAIAKGDISLPSTNAPTPTPTHNFPDTTPTFTLNKKL